MYFICTDGSCSGNPGPGGYAAIVKNNFISFNVLGHEAYTTNQRMEIMAVLKGLESIPPHQEVVIITDSQYVINIATKGYKRKANKDLWALLDIEMEKCRTIEWQWLKGHNGHPDNEEVDRLAQAETAKAKSLLKGETNDIQGICGTASSAEN